MILTCYVETSGDYFRPQVIDEHQKLIKYMSDSKMDVMVSYRPPPTVGEIKKLQGVVAFFDDEGLYCSLIDRWDGQGKIFLVGYTSDPIDEEGLIKAEQDLTFVLNGGQVDTKPLKLEKVVADTSNVTRARKLVIHADGHTSEMEYDQEEINKLMERYYNYAPQNVSAR